VGTCGRPVGAVALATGSAAGAAAEVFRLTYSPLDGITEPG